MKNKQGTILILLAACFWGTSGLFVRGLSSRGLHTMQLILVRAIFTVLIMGAFILIKDKKLFKMKLRDIWLFAAIGILSVVMFNFCYYKTMSLTSLSVAAVLMYTAPFFVVVFSVFLFKEPLTIKKVIACICAFFGCCLISGVFASAGRISGQALFYGLLTGFGYSLYTIFSRLLLERGYNSLTVTFYTFVFAIIGCVPFCDVVSAAKLVSGSGTVAGFAFLMALINTVMPYILYTSGLAYMDASKAPVIATLEPVVATIIGAAVYKETITLTGFLGILLVVGSVAILNLKKGEGNVKINRKSSCEN